MNKFTILIALALCACTTIGLYPDPDPLPRILPVAASGFDGDLEAYEAGVRAWKPLGFDAVRVEDIPPTQRACPKNWYSNEPIDVDCHIPIRIERQEGVIAENGALGYAVREGRWIVIDASLSGLTLQGVAAHEIGHIILDTGTHSKDGGIMDSGDWVMSPGDYDLACESIGVCIEHP